MSLETDGHLSARLCASVVEAAGWGRLEQGWMVLSDDGYFDLETGSRVVGSSRFSSLLVLIEQKGHRYTMRSLHHRPRLSDPLRCTDALTLL